LILQNRKRLSFRNDENIFEHENSTSNACVIERYAVGSAVLSPLPKTDKDFDWDGANALIAEASEPIT
jgi:hypothetical protein